MDVLLTVLVLSVAEEVSEVDVCVVVDNSVVLNMVDVMVTLVVTAVVLVVTEVCVSDVMDDFVLLVDVGLYVDVTLDDWVSDVAV